MLGRVFMLREEGFINVRPTLKQEESGPLGYAQLHHQQVFPFTGVRNIERVQPEITGARCIPIGRIANVSPHPQDTRSFYFSLPVRRPSILGGLALHRCRISPDGLG